MITPGDHQRSLHITGAVPTGPALRRKKQSFKFGVGAEKHLFKNTFVGARPCDKHSALIAAECRQLSLCSAQQVRLQKSWLLRTGIHKRCENYLAALCHESTWVVNLPGWATCGADQSQLISPRTLCPDKHSCRWTEVIHHSERAVECDVWESRRLWETQRLIWGNKCLRSGLSFLHNLATQQYWKFKKTQAHDEGFSVRTSWSVLWNILHLGEKGR